MSATLSAARMYAATSERDASFDGMFFAAVKTTNIFCRPSCAAKTPARENVDFYETARDALLAGFRPCLRCRPLEPLGAVPVWLAALLESVELSPDTRWTDADLRARGLDPSRVRRWFLAHHGMTFHAFHRARRVGRALGKLKNGSTVTSAAFEAGYESLSAFYDAFQRLTGRTPATGRNAPSLYLGRIASPIGVLLAGSTQDGICLLEFMDRRMLETQLHRLTKRLRCAVMPEANVHIRQLQRELEDYFAGTRRRFDVALSPVGTAFQREAWNALLQIPLGETRSYSEQAICIGRPNAIRAVARANGDNNIAIVIACHRVIGASGELTGYGGGLWRKRWLLEHEARIRDRTADSDANTMHLCASEPPPLCT